MIVDGDRGTRETLRVALAEDGFGVRVAACREEALAHDWPFDVIVADARLDLDELQARWPGSEIVVVTCLEGLDRAAAAVSRGAFDFVMRPFFVEDVSLTVACAAARRRRTLDCPLRYVHKFHDAVR